MRSSIDLNLKELFTNGQVDYFMKVCFLIYSEAGELYKKKLANFVEKRLKSERTASVCIY